jgi:hypothetical protein
MLDIKCQPLYHAKYTQTYRHTDTQTQRNTSGEGKCKRKNKYHPIKLGVQKYQKYYHQKKANEDVGVYVLVHHPGHTSQK